MRLAASYISHLSEMLADDNNANNIHDFQVNLANINSKKSLSYDYRPIKRNSLLDNGISISQKLANVSPIYIAYKNENVNDKTFLVTFDYLLLKL